MGTGHVHSCAKFPSLSPRPSREEEIGVSEIKSGSAFSILSYCFLKEQASTNSFHLFSLTPIDFQHVKYYIYFTGRQL